MIRYPNLHKHPRGFLSAMLLLALIVCAGVFSSCTSPQTPATDVATEQPETTETSPTSLVPHKVVTETLEPAPTTAPVLAPTPYPEPTAIVIPEPTPAYGPTGRPTDAIESYILVATDSVTYPVVYDKPGGEPVPVEYHFLNGQVDRRYDWFKNPTFFNNPLTLRVLQGKPGAEWAKVMVPTRPIREAWIPAADWEWESSNYYVQVNIANNTLTVWDGDDRIVDEVSVVTGSSGRATPLASTFIDEIMPGPSGAYGPWLLSLGVFSDELNTFGSAGALPKTAIHGTNQPHLLGQYASNGCVRIPNDVITDLAQKVPVGTRVDIVDIEASESDESATQESKETETQDNETEQSSDG